MSWCPLIAALALGLSMAILVGVQMHHIEIENANDAFSTFSVRFSDVLSGRLERNNANILGLARSFEVLYHVKPDFEFTAFKHLAEPFIIDGVRGLTHTRYVRHEDRESFEAEIVDAQCGFNATTGIRDRAPTIPRPRAGVREQYTPLRFAINRDTLADSALNAFEPVDIYDFNGVDSTRQAIVNLAWRTGTVVMSEDTRYPPAAARGSTSFVSVAPIYNITDCFHSGSCHTSLNCKPQKAGDEWRLQHVIGFQYVTYIFNDMLTQLFPLIESSPEASFSYNALEGHVFDLTDTQYSEATIISSNSDAESKGEPVKMASFQFGPEPAFTFEASIEASDLLREALLHEETAASTSSLGLESGSATAAGSILEISGSSREWLRSVRIQSGQREWMVVMFAPDAFIGQYTSATPLITSLVTCTLVVIVVAISFHMQSRASKGNELIKRLKRLSTDLHAILDTLPNSLLLMRGSHIAECNNSAIAKLELDSPDDIIGKPIWAVFRGLDRFKFQAIAAEAAIHCVEHRFDVTTKSGIVFPAMISFVTSSMNDTVICVFRDLTKQIQARNAILKSKKAAEDANISKDEFMTFLFHEVSSAGKITI